MKKYVAPDGSKYKQGDLFVWSVEGKATNPLLVGYLYFDEDDNEWYIGDENAYPHPSGYDPSSVIEDGFIVGNIYDSNRSSKTS
jgi:hypothetical protein